MFKIKIKYSLEISDHDGYCSGQECEYQLQKIKKTFYVSEGQNNYEKIEKYFSLEPEGTLKVLFENEKHYFLKNEDFYNYLEKPCIGGQSYYCTLSEECQKAGIGHHEYKFSDVKITISKK